MRRRIRTSKMSAGGILIHTALENPKFVVQMYKYTPMLAFYCVPNIYTYGEQQKTDWLREHVFYAGLSLAINAFLRHIIYTEPLTTT